MGLKREYDYGFERVWKSYPRHEGKAEAAREFEKLALSDEEVDELVAHVEKRKREDSQWLPNAKGNTFVPHLCRFLKHRRFEDDYKRIRSASIRAPEVDARPPWEARGMTESDWRAHCDEQHRKAMAEIRRTGLLH